MDTQDRRSVVETVVKIFPVIAAVAGGVWTIFIYFHPPISGASELQNKVVSSSSQDAPIQSSTPTVSVAPVSSATDSQSSKISVDLEPEAQVATSEFGGAPTAAAAVQSFYAYLHDGNGEEASKLVVPEKRVNASFEANQLTKFYGKLRVPIYLVDVTNLRSDFYQVHYRYTATKSICDGQALVQTTDLQGRYFILGIKALNGC